MTSLQSLPAELLEHTIWHLPTTDLYLAQGVCKEWKALILGSAKLKGALFLLAQDVQKCLRLTNYYYETSLYGPESAEWDKRIVGHLEMKSTRRVVKANPADQQGPRFTRWRISDQHSLPEFNEGRYPIGQINDMFFNCEPMNCWAREVVDPPDEWLRSNAAFQSAARSASDGLWRHMYITQPPFKYVRYSWDFRTTSKPPGRRRRVAPHQTESNKEGHIWNANGVTIGQLVDRIKELEREVQGQIVWKEDALILEGFMRHSDVEQAQIRAAYNRSDGIDFVGLDLTKILPGVRVYDGRVWFDPTANP